MLLNWGFGIAAGSGSVGGVTAARNRGGNYLRNRSVPVNPNTPKQGIVRGNLAQLQSDYRLVLTQAERESWQALAADVTFSNKLGVEKRLTPINLFIRANAIQLFAGEALITVAPAAPAGTLVPDTVLLANIIGGTLVLDSITPIPGAAEITLVAYAGPFSQAVNFHKSPWTETVAIVGPPTVPLTLATLPSIVAGQRFFFQVRSADGLGRATRYVPSTVQAA